MFDEDYGSERESVDHDHSIRACSRPSRQAPLSSCELCSPYLAHQVRTCIPERAAALTKLNERPPLPLLVGTGQPAGDKYDGGIAERGDYYFHHTNPLASCVHSTIPYNDLSYAAIVLDRSPEVDSLDLTWNPREGAIITVLWRRGVTTQHASSILESHIPDITYANVV
jgi:hypothetical protein